MSVEQALKILDSALAQMQLTRQQHANLMNALAVLAKASGVVEGEKKHE